MPVLTPQRQRVTALRVAAVRGAADKLRRMVEAIDSHRPVPVRGSADEECETWDGCRPV